MQSGVFTISLAYALLGAVLLVILIRVSMPRFLKIASVAIISSAYCAVFFAATNLLGWSAPIAVPDKFQVLWTRVIEPNPSRNEPGAVHLWLEELDERNIPSGKPRAFLLPYSRELATKVSAAQQEIKKGHNQGGRARNFNKAQGMEMPEGINIRSVVSGVAAGGDPSGGGPLDPSKLGGQSKAVDLIPLPPPDLPPKGDPVIE